MSRQRYLENHVAFFFFFKYCRQMATVEAGSGWVCALHSFFAQTTTLLLALGGSSSVS